MSLTNELEKRLIEKARINRHPLTVNFELLPVCNLNCAMCYIRSDWKDVEKFGGLKNADEWLALARELQEAGTLFLLLTGGEVFLYPEFKKLYIELYMMGFSVTINTNATMINEETVEWLSQYPPKCISISLYGSNDEMYEKVCQRKGMFTKFNHAIALLQEKNLVLELKTVMNPYNIDDIPNCLQYAKDKGISYEATAYSFPAIRKINQEEQVRFTPQEAVDANYYFTELAFDDEQKAKSVKETIEKYENTRHRQGCVMKGLTCSAGNYSCWINWQGRMTPCGMMNEPYEEPFKIGFMNAWESIKKKTDQIPISENCSNCDKREICSICPASANAETGEFCGTSSYHCQMTDYLIKRMYQYVDENLKE